MAEDGEVPGAGDQLLGGISYTRSVGDAEAGFLQNAGAAIEERLIDTDLECGGQL